ncbi:IS1595 family transposase [Bradyrhizobium sp. Bra64]|uniref:IS1595 family transposase n=1 Tax=Bradyrhizobium sp. Bra64 TaxID=2926009 RepID=UPI002117321E|nr:IS1595 family transposase [Bradyrhizobium sp. Bra64]
MSQFNAPHFQSHEAARAYLEAIRWGAERVCPHCGTVGKSYENKKKPGVYRCAAKECRKDFTVTTKSVMESSHVKLHVWLQAFYLMASSKKGVSSHQLHRALGVTYKTAWFLTHRIREAMRAGGLLAPLGAGGKVVEVDETFYGFLEGQPKTGRRAWSNKNVVLTLVERGGSARSFHVDGVRVGDLMPIIRENLSREAQLMTDEANAYKFIAETDGLDHSTVTHSKDEYVRREGDKVISTNTVEGYYSIFKRGMKGVYQHCSEKHLHRYLAEFDFRYSNRVALGIEDGERADLAVKGAAGKRLTYRQSN